MKELLWQIKKDKWAYVFLMLLFGGCLIPFLMFIGEDNPVEAIFRLLMLFLGMCALFLYGERGKILKRKAPGAAFYRSMTEGLKKEKRRILVLDVFFFSVSTVVYLLYKAVGVLVTGCFDGGILYVGFLLYLVCLQMLVRHPYWLLCVTMMALVILGMAALFKVPFWGLVIGIVVCVAGMTWHYRRIERMWNEEE